MFKSLNHVFSILLLISKFKKIFNMSKHSKINFLISKTNWEVWDRLSTNRKNNNKSNNRKKEIKIKKKNKSNKTLIYQTFKNKLKQNNFPSINFKKTFLEQSLSKSLTSHGMMLLDLTKPKRLFKKLLYCQLSILKFLLVKDLLGKESYFLDLLELVKLFLQRHVQLKWKEELFSVFQHLI